MRVILLCYGRVEMETAVEERCEVDQSSRRAGSVVPPDYLSRKPASYRVNYPYSYYVLGGVSLGLAPWFIARGFSANRVTLLSGVLLVLALAIISTTPLGWGVAIAGVLLHGVLLLDNIDGCIADSTGTKTLCGAFADSLVSWLQNLGLPLCIGWALLRYPPEWWTAAIGLHVAPWCWLALGVVRALAYLLTIVVTQFSQRALQVEGYEQRVASRRALLAIKALLEGEVLVLVIAPLAGMVGLAHVGYTLLHVCVLGAVVIKNATDMRRRDRQAPRSVAG